MSAMSLPPSPLLSQDELPALLVRRWPERRVVVLLASAALFVVVFALRLADRNESDAVSLLFVVPIALLAMELGPRAGVTAALLAIGLVVVWTLVRDTGIGPFGYFTRTLVFTGIGLVVGRFAERMRGAQERQAELLASGLALARLDEGADLTGLVAARVLGAPGACGARVTLEGLPSHLFGRPSAHRLVLPLESRHSSGELEVFFTRRLPALEERAQLAALALQAAIAAENRLLLQRERERAGLERELQQVRLRVHDQRRSLQAVIADQERQRSAVAVELHEEAAQALSGVLLAIRALQRRDGEGERPELDRVRDLVHDTVVELRRIATGLRPVTLDQLGLGPALAHLGEQAAAERGAPVAIDATGLPPRLPTDVDTAVYRVVEDAVQGLAGPLTVSVAGEDGSAVRIHVAPVPGADGDRCACTPANLEVIRARVELLGGRLEPLAGGGLDAVLPAAPVAVA